MSEIHTREGAACFKERIVKENAARREWEGKFGDEWKTAGGASWRPVEPYEPSSCSSSFLERPERGVPTVARRFPKMFIDTVGDDGLVGGTPKRFGGHWDCTRPWIEPAPLEPDKPPRNYEKGPHDCYLPIGHGCAKLPPKSRHGLKSSMASLWTDTPGALAMVWLAPGEDDAASVQEQVS